MMDIHVIYIAGTLLISMVCGLISIPLIINFCYKHNIFDMPTARKVHKRGIPRLGGVCFLPSMLAAILAVVPMLNSHSETGNEVTISLWSCMFFLSLALIYSTGLTDDIVGLGPDQVGRTDTGSLVSASLWFIYQQSLWFVWHSRNTILDRICYYRIHDCIY